MLGASPDRNMIFKLKVEAHGSTVHVNFSQPSVDNSYSEEDSYDDASYYNDPETLCQKQHVDKPVFYSGSESDTSSCNEDDPAWMSRWGDTYSLDEDDEEGRRRMSLDSALRPRAEPMEHSCSLTRSSCPAMGTWFSDRRCRARKGERLSVVGPKRDLHSGLCAQREATENDELGSQGAISTGSDEINDHCDVTSKVDDVTKGMTDESPPPLHNRMPRSVSR